MAGLLILVPIVITVNSLWWLFTYVDGLAQPVAIAVLGRPIAGVGFVTTIAVVFLTGVLFSSGSAEAPARRPRRRPRLRPGGGLGLRHHEEGPVGPRRARLRRVVQALRPGAPARPHHARLPDRDASP